MPDLSGYIPVIGTDRRDVIHGTSSNELIYGLGGDDSLYGRGGDDILSGDGGTDRLYGGGGLDIAAYLANTTPVRVDLTTGVVSFPGKPWPSELLFSIEGAWTGSGADTLIGNGFANVFDGGAGNDTISGAGGNDILHGGGGRDLVQGGNGNDTLSGGTGNDRLHAGGGNDVIYLGASELLMLEYDGLGPAPVPPPYGVDAVDGGTGIDTLAFADVIVEGGFFNGFHDLYLSPGMIVDLALGQIRTDGISGPSSSITGVENVAAGNGDDRVVGNSGDNVIRLGDGSNTAFGGAGHDTIHGGEWDYFDERDPDTAFQEVLSGGAGNDTIFGNGAHWEATEGLTAQVERGRERLDGGAGNDRLVTGAGAATLSGGSGADRFEFRDDTWDDAERGGFGFLFGFGHSVTDFDPTEGDKLVFSMVNSPNAPDPVFVGETADPASLDLLELGYSVVASGSGGNDTVLRMIFQPEDYGVGPLPVMFVRLLGYDGGLSADDILFA